MANDLALETLYFDTAEGIRLHAKACGPARAPVLLFVHGFPEFWYTWRRQLAEFSADFRCVAIDLRGFNLSSQPVDVSAYKPHLLVADLRGVIQALGAPVPPTPQATGSVVLSMRRTRSSSRRRWPRTQASRRPAPT